MIGRFVLVTVVLAGCSAPDLGIDVDFVRDASNTVIVSHAGRYQVSVRACVPGLASARATIAEVETRGDGGLAGQELVLIPDPDARNCDRGGLSGTATLVLRRQGRVRLEVAVLGRRVELSDELMSSTTGALAPGGLTFSPTVIPARGGNVAISAALTTPFEGGVVTFSTLPSLPLSAPRVTLDATQGSARVLMAVPDDVLEVWVEAVMGSQRVSACVAVDGRSCTP